MILKGRKAIAKYLYISSATLGRHRDEIPHWRVGNQLFADTDELDRWMREQYVKDIERSER